MPKYLCVQRKLSGGDRGKSSPSEMQEMYANFNAWREKFEKNLVELGGKLGDGKFVTAGPITNGPFVEVKELVGGYLIVSADSLDEATEVVRTCPGLVRAGSGVEVSEIRTP